MARISHIVEGLTILSKYVNPDDHLIAAEHDIIYAGPSEVDTVEDGMGDVVGSVVSPIDAARLRGLGWFIDSETESWAHFV